MSETDRDTQGKGGLEGRRTRLNRRDMIASNIKAIGAVMASAIVATVVTPAKARTPCFLRGTKIRTTSGERNIERLEIGELLPTVFGGVRPIQWITRYHQTAYDIGKPWMRDGRPVCIKSSAIDDNIPSRDLYVTAGHSILVDGLLVPAGSLINGMTILECDAEDLEELEFFQIKLETHDVIYAEGAPCETLLRVSKSEASFAQYRRRYGDPKAADLHCAPIVCNGASREIRSRVRSTVSPWFGPQKIDIIRDRLEARAFSMRSAGQLSTVVPNLSYLIESAAG